VIASNININLRNLLINSLILFFGLLLPDSSLLLSGDNACILLSINHFVEITICQTFSGQVLISISFQTYSQLRLYSPNPSVRNISSIIEKKKNKR
jgi:hypothetical protein